MRLNEVLTENYLKYFFNGGYIAICLNWHKRIDFARNSRNRISGRVRCKPRDYSCASLPSIILTALLPTS